MAAVNYIKIINPGRAKTIIQKNPREIEDSPHH
jgi:hypothetical protein